ncbi:MAG TPA: peptidoglycan DD-metalloendopeptidase family protein [Vicinamibacterales bacterium]|jgi:murein DD-endopeptidase MepM/ murein hydrolase activator NlpD
MAQDLALGSSPQTFSLVTGQATTAPGSPAGTPNAQTAKMKDLAQQFESLLLLQMIREMKNSLDSTGEEDGSGTLMSGTGTMTETMDAAFAQQLGKFGGFGLSNALMSSFMRQDGGAAPGATPAALAPAAAAASAGSVPIANAVAAALPAASVPIANAVAAALPAAPESSPTATALPDLGEVLDAPVNSAFGWRKDPINGETRFHSGVDLRAAYGQPVPVVGDGTVAFAGEQQGYGLTVVVQHADGIETRYAHLSSVDVQPGSAVRAGDIIGRVGQSGRATGPHLHFEVIENGHTVNPESLDRQE